MTQSEWHKEAAMEDLVEEADAGFAEAAKPDELIPADGSKPC